MKRKKNVNSDLKIVMHKDFSALEKSSYAIVALDRVMRKIYDHLDYPDEEYKYLLFELQQETMEITNWPFGTVIDEAKEIQKRLYKGLQITQEN